VDTTLRDGDLTVTVDPAAGARLAQLRWRDHDLLVADGLVPFGNHSFVMAPWAGRVRDASARWDGRTLALPVGDAPHALHGVVHDRRWQLVDATPTAAVTTTDVTAAEWFAPLRLEQRVEVRDGAVRLHLAVDAPHEPAPVTIGWHPWFRRVVGGTTVEVTVPGGAVLRRDAAGIATDERIAVPGGPLDDALVDLAGPVVVRYPGLVEVAVMSDAPVTVVYTGHPRGVCVEPQSGPPDEVNRPTTRVVRPGRPLELRAEFHVSPTRGVPHRRPRRSAVP
jgi:aldose 1-epimerase